MDTKVAWHLAAFPRLRAGAEAGDRVAMFHLAHRYRDGRDVEASVPLTLHWVLKSVDQGYSRAQSLLGVLYYYGEGVPKSHRQAMKWYRAAAAQGDFEGLYNVGELFDESDEYPKNPVEACAWMLVAATRGFMQGLDRIDRLVREMSFDNVELAARRGAQILRHVDQGLSLEEQGDFIEAQPLPHAALPQGHTPPTRLSIMVEFAHHSGAEKAEILLFNELATGDTPLYLRARHGAPGEEEVPAPAPGNALLQIGCLARNPDGMLQMLVFTDYQKLREFHRDGQCLNAPSEHVVAIMEREAYHSMVVNPGTASCYVMENLP